MSCAAPTGRSSQSCDISFGTSRLLKNALQCLPLPLAEGRGEGGLLDSSLKAGRLPIMTNAARAICTLLVAVSLLAAAPAAGQVLEREVVIVTPDAGDERVTQTHDAVAFWNETLSDLDLGVRLRETDLVVASENRALENYARLISQRGGRLPRGAAGPQPPRELIDLGADVVVLLSRQPLMPFAWPLPGSTNYFVAIRAVEPRRPGDDKVLRNVIAHELGHTLGLTHNRATATLMCGPCSSAAAEDNPLEWLPLTADDRARLRALHGAQ